jgi:hypothetical protein
VAALPDELGLEADGRAIGDDLEIMVRKARQQRAGRHLVDVPDRPVDSALGAKLRPEIGDFGIFRIAREIEEDAVRPEILDGPWVDIADRREGSAGQKRDPVIIGPHMHAALIGADIGRPVHHGVLVRPRAERAFFLESPQTIHSQPFLAPRGKQAMRQPWLRSG